MAERSSFQTLADLLDHSVLELIIKTERFAPSTIYDLQYRMAIVACAFQQHAKRDLVETRRIRSAELKLLQFVACRPWLLPQVEEWSRNRQNPQESLLSSQRVRRGFLSDGMHDRVVALLVARTILTQSGSHVLSGPQVSVLDDIAMQTVRLELFPSERQVLTELMDVAITNKMLEGS